MRNSRKTNNARKMKVRLRTSSALPTSGGIRTKPNGEVVVATKPANESTAEVQESPKSAAGSQ
jgi:hypothetical protein